MAFSLTVSGFPKFLDKLSSIKAELNKMLAINLKAAIEIEKWVYRNFQADGRLHEQSKYFWPPLRPSTIARRRKGAGTGTPKILRDTGRLMGAFQHLANNQYGEVFNRTVYSKTHELGAGIVPQRKIFPTLEQAEEIVLPVYQKEIDRLVKET